MTATTLAEALPLLRAPFTPAAVKWKVNTAPKDGKKGTAVAFVDARLVAERLNDVVGGAWMSSMRPGPEVPKVGAGAYSVVCSLTVMGTTHEDVGYGTHPKDVEVALKAAYSDALKRAAVQFGIGAPLYSLPKAWLDPQDVRGSFLTREREAALRHTYSQWVCSPQVVQRFGAPIDHGDGLADASGPVPQNFPQEGRAPNAEAFRVLAKERGLGGAQVAQLLDAVGAPANPDLKARVDGASVEQLDAAIERIKGAAAA
jgi:hypothetical protein